MGDNHPFELKIIRELDVKIAECTRRLRALEDLVQFQRKA
jgi:hypothetical protein